METKYIADSILGGVTIDDELILDLYMTKEFKRLARVNHLGIVHFIYPMAKHYRLEHSLGVYELTRRVLDKLNPDVPKDTYRAVLAAGLLHDLGHGPFSHLFELVSKYDHEDYSIDIINSVETEIYKVFEKHEPKAREQVIQILQGKHPLAWCNQLISSEVDMDRLDYLLRDSESTGAAYGQIDWRWLMKNARIHPKTNELVFKEKALPVIESMLLGRYHMNVSVYWNPKNVANQQLYKFWWMRMKYLYKNKLLIHNYSYLKKVLEDKKMTTTEFNNLDDTIFYSALRYSTEEKDEILTKISDMLLRHELPLRYFGDDEVNEFVKSQDEKLENQTWSVVDIPTNFKAYQKVHALPAKIWTHTDEIVSAVEYSSVINFRTDEKNRYKKLGVKIKE